MTQLQAGNVFFWQDPPLQKLVRSQSGSAALAFWLHDCPAFASATHVPFRQDDSRHTAFVQDRWNREVDSFLEIDYEPL